jgi:type I restriction enzyme S subunit
MAMAEEVGYERKTKDAKEIEANHLVQISTIYKDYKASKRFEHLTNDKKVIDILQETPACFIIGENNLSDRLDAPYYYAKYIFNVSEKQCKVTDVARLSKVLVNPSKEPLKEIRYVQFSNVEKELGSITCCQNLLGNEAPSRARLLVSKGDVICARVKDSEENVALIPDELNGIIVSTGFVVLKPIPPMTSEALYVLLRLKTTLNQVRWKSAGTIMPAITDNEYLTIKLPQLSKEQINKITSEIKAVESQRKFIRDKLKQLSIKL